MTKNKPISPGKRYVLRVLDLAKKDPQIGALMPKETVWDAMAVEGLTQDRVIDALLDGYAFGRPTLIWFGRFCANCSKSAKIY